MTRHDDDQRKDLSICGKQEVSTYLLLGGNLGNVLETFKAATSFIGKEIGSINRSSSIYKSEAWGFDSDSHFYNQVIEISTELAPQKLLEQILALENRLGRTRASIGEYESRNIDIDVLFYGDAIISTPQLEVPHPRIPDRKFTLLPLVELIPNFVHPTHKITLTELLNNSTDQGNVWKA